MEAFQTIALKSISRGIDQRSVETSIADGYCEDLLNVDVNSNGYLTKRVGYQGYYGKLPLRVSAVSHLDNVITFTLDQSIDASNLPQGPLVVYGKLPAAQSGDFSTTPHAVWYPSFSSDIRLDVNAPSGQITRPQSLTGVTSTNLAVGFALSTSASDNSSSQVLASLIRVNTPSADVFVDYTIASPGEAFVWVADKVNVVGASYTASFVAQTTVTVPAATHALSTFNILAKVYKDNTTNFEQVTPASLSITPVGDVVVTFAVATTGKVVLWSVPNTQQASASFTGTSTVTVVSARPFAFFSCYAANPLTGNLDEIIPDAITYDAPSQTHTITLTTTSGADTVTVYYDFATITSNKITVLDTTDTAVTYAYPTAAGAVQQLTIWGGSDALAVGVNAVDTYRRPGEDRVVSGLGGNLYAARSRAEAGTTYRMPLVHASDVHLVLVPGSPNVAALGPAFVTTGQIARSGTPGGRPTVTGDDVVSGRCVVTDVAFNVGTGWVDYTLAVTNQVGTFAAALDVVSGRNDWLTVTGVANSRHNGLFEVMSVTDTGTGAVVSVLNTAVTTGDFDESGMSARAGVFTDQINYTDAPRYIPGDTFTGSSFSGLTCVVKSSYISGGVNLTAVDGFTRIVLLADGQQVGVTRTARVVSLDASVFDVGHIVPGDMLTVSSLVREVRALHVQPYSDVALTVTASAGVATATTGTAVAITTIVGAVITTASAHGLRNGQPVRFRLLSGSAPTAIHTGLTYYVIENTSTSFFASPTGLPGTGVTPGPLGGASVTVERVHNLSVGQRVLVSQTGVTGLDGVQQVTGVVDDTHFQYASTATAVGVTGLLSGSAVELDEAISVSYDPSTATSLAVTGRWVPVEVPTTTGDIPVTTTIQQFRSAGYTTQPTVRSAMVANNLYLTNYTDEVLKFDGTALYQAGLFRWQPQLFVTVDTTGTNSLGQDAAVLAFTARDPTAQSFTTPNAGAAKVGQRYSDPVTGKIFTVKEVQKNTDAAGATDLVYMAMDDGVTFSATAPGTLRKVVKYGYYFRMVAYDVNNNVVATAAVGQKDSFVELTAAANIHMKLVGMPAWNFYDYDRVFVQVFRTRADVIGYELVKQIPLTVSSAVNQYVAFLDSTTDTSLKGVDDTTTAVNFGKPARADGVLDLGAGLEQPPRAKYVTTIGNRLVLMNIKDYPELNVVLRARATPGGVTSADLDGLKWTFKRDATDTGSTSDMADRQTYQFVDQAGANIRSVTGVTVTTPGVGSATNFEVTTAAPHSQIVGNWVYLYYATTGVNRHPKFSGWWVVKDITSATKFRVDFVDDGTVPGAVVNGCAVATTARDVPVYLGTDGNLGWLGANPLAATSYEGTAMPRLASAVNATTKVWETYAKLNTLSYSPWMIANAGSDYQPGQMIVRQPKSATVSMSIKTPVLGAGDKVDTYIDNVKQASAAVYTVTTKVFASRIVVSYPNLPETFDNPAASPDKPGDSAVDINTADGQEITGGLPFFGEAVFGTGQAEGLLVIFKTASIYVYDLIKRQLQKVESHGQGCTAPYSIASTKDGIMFANNSGVYRLNRDLSVTYVGRYLERLWTDSVNRSSLSSATGHFYGVGRRYKLSVPVGSDTANSQVYVYDYTQETPGGLSGPPEMGGWVRHDNHPVTGWANLLNDAFFGTTDGQVMKVRTANDATDYRDDAAAIPATILLKTTDFGVAARKLMGWVVSQFRVAKSNMYGTQLDFAVDSHRVFETTQPFRVTLDTVSGHKVYSLRSTPPTRRAKHFQLKYTNATMDEEMTLASVEFVVAPLSFHGTQEKADTN